MTVDPLTAEFLANGPFARHDAPYLLVEVAGPDAGEFLQRLCTQDVLGLPPGGVAPAAFLDAKGKVLVTCLVCRLDGSFWLEVQREQDDRLVALLERYHFTEKVTVGRPVAGGCRETVARARVAPTEPPRAARAANGLRILFERRGVRFDRCHGGGPGHAGEADPGGRASTDPKPLSTDLGECLRMAAGFVRVGVETEPTTLALEADLDDHCSTTKGCYTGQEVVARIHTYGHVNRRLRLLHLAAGPTIEAPVALHEPDDQLPVGRVLHAVPAPGHPLRVGLGYLPKDFQGIGTKLVLPDGGSVTVVGWADV